MRRPERIAAAVLLLASTTAAAQVDERRGIVVQWLMPSEAGEGIDSPFECIRLDLRIGQSAGRLYDADGNDVGSGTCNVFLFTQKVPETVAALVAMEGSGRLPRGMRIGVQRFRDAAHTDWDYTPVHPAGLREFRLMYR